MGENVDSEPVAELDDRFSSPGASPISWTDGIDLLSNAKVYWLTTIREDGSPHVTSVAGVWLDDTVYITTGEDEQKARNLEHNIQCAIITGCNVLEGFDVVVEADAVRETDPTRLQALADAYRAKYGDLFVFAVRDGVLRQQEGAGEVIAYRLQAQKTLAFGKGAEFSQTPLAVPAGLTGGGLD